MTLQYHYGIKIGEEAEIGPGMYIYHYGGIFVNGNTILGKNVDINQDVTIGKTQARYGKNGGAPNIGDNVLIGAGERILGPISIGSGTAIGANAVVTKNVPEFVSVGGNPAKIISQKGLRDLLFNPI